jgi:DNA-directed RNA polymerase subunit RPC12/RpoP
MDVEATPELIHDRLDACPECRERVLARPSAAVVEGDTLNCVYACRRCGHTWSTSWGIPELA